MIIYVVKELGTGLCENENNVITVVKNKLKAEEIALKYSLFNQKVYDTSVDEIEIKEDRRGCPFCNGDEHFCDFTNKYFSAVYNKSGIEMYIEKKEGTYTMILSSLPDSIDDCGEDKAIEINYCPICGKKLEVNKDE